MKTITIRYANDSGQIVYTCTVKRLKAIKLVNGGWDLPRKFNKSMIKEQKVIITKS